MEWGKISPIRLITWKNDDTNFFYKRRESHFKFQAYFNSVFDGLVSFDFDNYEAEYQIS